MISLAGRPLQVAALYLYVCYLIGSDTSVKAFSLPTTGQSAGYAHALQKRHVILRSTAAIAKEASSTPSVAPSSAVGLQSNQESLEELYPQFPRTWVPLASTLEMDPDRPTPLEFLGQTYVTYRSSSSDDSSVASTWVVMDNACPHRLAPLSEGRVELETRRLQCSYHGWTFEADGSCQRIPQATPSTEQAAIQNPRSCVPTYSTYVDPQTGVLWIWPWKQVALSFVGEEWRHPEGVMKTIFPDSHNATSTITALPSVMTYTRDQPYGWDTLVENLIDPAHIPFAHHGMQGSRKDAIPINMTRAVDRGEAGFLFDWGDRTMGMLRSGTGEFRAPYLVSYNAKFESKDGDSPGRRPWLLSVLCVPTKPGWSRVMVFSSPPAEPVEKVTEPKADEATKASAAATKKSKMILKRKKKPSLVSAIFRNLPPWVSHLLSNKFFDSDLVFLHYQEQRRRPNSGNKAASLRGDARYFMPSECDRSIAALHGWIGQYAPSYIHQQATQLPSALYDRSKLFDHWGQHTSHCKICQNALAGIKKWKRNSKLALAASIIFGFRHWAPRVLAVACFGVIQVLRKIEEAFYKGEFKHYENH